MNTKIINRTRPQSVTISVFGTYQHGKLAGRVNPKAKASVTLKGFEVAVDPRNPGSGFRWATVREIIRGFLGKDTTAEGTFYKVVDVVNVPV